MIKIYGIDEQLDSSEAKAFDGMGIRRAWRWWWPGAGGKVCPLPDEKRFLLWFEPRATGRWRAVFYANCQMKKKDRRTRRCVSTNGWTSE